MSWDITLCDRSGAPITLEAKHNFTGGTYVLGGIDKLWLNVTYNYGKHFEFGKLDGLTGAQSLELMVPAYEKLKTGPLNDDYWAATEGNVAKALEPLIAWAREYPDGVWEVT
jgi:hypothetical protein